MNTTTTIVKKLGGISVVTVVSIKLTALKPSLPPAKCVETLVTLRYVYLRR
jgi:hypothetical protein